LISKKKKKKKKKKNKQVLAAAVIEHIISGIYKVNMIPLSVMFISDNFRSLFARHFLFLFLFLFLFFFLWTRIYFFKISLYTHKTALGSSIVAGLFYFHIHYAAESK